MAIEVQPVSEALFDDVQTIFGGRGQIPDGQFFRCSMYGFLSQRRRHRRSSA